MNKNDRSIFYSAPKKLKWLLIIIPAIILSLLFSQPTQAGDNGGSALSFDGNDTLQTTATIFSTTACTQPYTIELWLRTTAIGGGLVTQYGAASSLDRFGLRLSSGNVMWWHGSEGPVITSNDTVVNDGQWHHVVATRDSGGTVNFYIDGNLDSVSGSDTDCFENAVVRFGSFDPGNVPYTGELDDIRIWDVARNQSQIQANMFHEFDASEATAESNLIGYWPLSEGSGQTTADISNGGHTATLGTTPGGDTADPTWLANSTAPIGDATAYAQTGLAGFWAGVNPTSSGGLIFTDNSFLTDVGDDIIFGHNNLTGKTPDDLPTDGVWSGASDPRRWNRVWYCDLNDQNSNGGTVDIAFDFADAGMGADPAPAGDANNYRLLERAETIGLFVDLGGATSVDTGNRIVTFTGVSVSDVCSYITLGTLDETNSPTAINLQSFSANAGVPFVALVGMFGLAFSGLALWRRRKAM